MEEKKKIKIGITLGDINSIAPEVVIKALYDERIMKFCQFIVYGNEVAINYHKKLIAHYKTNFHLLTQTENKLNHKSPNLISIGDQHTIVNLGQANDFAGKMALSFINTALQDLKEGKIDALVTAPINKSTIKLEKETFTGHTEYISKYFGSQESMMLMVHNDLRIGLATNHLPLEQISSSLNANVIMRKLKIFQKSLKEDFGIDKPRIAVLSLNPHAGDNGLLGKEEKEIIIPAIQKSMDADLLAYGPFAADGFFGTGQFKYFDGILAMYHDQGLIPFKALSGSEGVNFTAGLPVIRTSPDHGTAYDIAGKDLADHSSLLNAIYLALDVHAARQLKVEYGSNPIQKSKHRD
jgi:4-hydroxythreonine-4-phosphate dehydrogenase